MQDFSTALPQCSEDQSSLLQHYRLDSMLHH
jgi:hypothetical protein